MKTLIICFVAIAANAAHLPSSFKTCKHSDGNYQECITKAATEAIASLNNGNKDLGVPKFDPIFVKKIHFHSKGGAVNLEQKYNDVNVFGFSKGKFLNFDYKIDDNNNCEVKFAVDTPRIDQVAPYEAKGKILVLSLSGHGQSNISMYNLLTTIEGKCEVRDGFLNVKEFKLNFEPKRVVIAADNLVDGNPELSAEVLKVMNENWLDVFNEVKAEYEATYAEVFKQFANSIFNKVPLVEVLPQ